MRLQLDTVKRASVQQMLVQQAQEQVLTDLVNALLQENVLKIAERGELSEGLPAQLLAAGVELAAEEQCFRLQLENGHNLVFRVRPQRFLQSYKISRPPVYLLSADETDTGNTQVQTLDPIGLMLVLGDLATEEERQTTLVNLQGFLDELFDAVEQTTLSLSAFYEFEQDMTVAQAIPMLAMERLSAFRDRPFHPTSRAKRGWNPDEYQQYSPEFGQEVSLAWVAVRREYLQQGEQAGEIAPSALTESELSELVARMQEADVSPSDYLAMPVHPWQMEHVLPTVYEQEIEQRIVVLLSGTIGRFVSTSSLRALASVAGGNRHVKVPIGIYSLAALRILPPRYLHNAERAQAVLGQVITAQPKLNGRLHLCNEEAWWGFHDPAGDRFGDKPGHLACLIREYPETLLSENVDLVAMSTLAVVSPSGGVPAFEQMLAVRRASHASAGHVDRTDRSADNDDVIALFHEIARSFIETTLLCYRYGLMPEVHGQNVMLSFERGHVTGMLLRDHDTIRLYLPWLEREGFQDPGYIVKPGTPNSLVNKSPQALLSYFQTLGLQVNLYAIVDALSRAYLIDENRFWTEIRRVIEAVLGMEEFPQDVRDVLTQQLLVSETWPTRTLIGPLLRRVGSGGGSMPADIGEANNPLLACDR